MFTTVTPFIYRDRRPTIVGFSIFMVSIVVSLAELFSILVLNPAFHGSEQHLDTSRKERLEGAVREYEKRGIGRRSEKEREKTG